MRARDVLFWGAFVCLLVPAGALTVVRLVEPGTGRAVEMEAFTPFGIPLYAAALLLLAVGLLVRASDRVVLLVPTGLAVLGLGLHLWWFAPLVTGSTPEPADDADPLTVMSANLFAGEGDAVSLVSEASKAKADVLVVVEITERALRDMDRVGLSEIFPHSTGEPGDDVEGTMVFSKEPIELVETLDTAFASLVVSTGDVTLLAVHPSPPDEGAAWNGDYSEIIQATEEFKPEILAGDFNATLDHPPVRKLLDAGYRDSVELTNGGLHPTWPDHGEYPIIGLFPPSVAIDHILLAKTWTATTSRTVEIADSDHRAVVAIVAPR